MTSCLQHQYIIDEVGDLDRLPPATSRHVDECEECAHFGRDLLALRDLLREPGRVAAPPDFDARLAERLVAHKAARPGSAHWVNAHRAPLAAAACLVVALSSTLAMRPWADEAINPSQQDTTTTQLPAPGRTVDDGQLAGLGTGGNPSSSDSLDTDEQSGGDATIANADPLARRPERRRARTVPLRLEPSSSELEIVMQGTQGTHLLSVKPVLYGAQEILPETAGVTGPGDSGLAVTSF